MHGRPPGLVLAVLLALGAVHAGTQDEELPTFQSDTQVVVLDVVATDGKGRPVDDLRGDDLEVSENGTPCEILSFRLVRAAPTPATSAPGATGIVASPSTLASTPAPTPSPVRASLVVLLFDRMTTQTAPLAREGGLDLLSQTFPPDTWFAVFKVGYGVRLLAPFTTDTVRLRSAIEAATLGDLDKRSRALAPSLPLGRGDPGARPPAPVAGPVIPDLGPVAEAVSGEESDLSRGVQGLDTLYAVHGIAQALSVVQGRKSIVYFGPAWHMPTRNRPVFDDAVSAANRANVAVHSVDVRGLTNRDPQPLGASSSVLQTFSADYDGGLAAGGRTSVAEAGGDPGAGGMALRRMEAMEERLSAPRLEHLSENTGGLAIRHTNDLGAGLAGVAQELRQYYEVVYAPADPVADGEFRRIEVKTSRRGVRLRTRVGYFATPGRPAAVHPYELPLLEALGASPPAHDFILRAGLLHFAPKGTERECLVLAEVPLSDVSLASDEPGGVYRAHLAFLGHVKDESGRVVARLSHDWPVEGPLDEKHGARLRSAVFRRELSLAPGRYVLEAAAQDRQTGARSVTRAAFRVPPAGDGLALSSVVVPRRAAPATAGDFDALRVGEVSLTPGLGQPVDAATRPELLVYVGAYAEPEAGPVTLKVEFRREGLVFAEASPALPLADAGAPIPWVGRLPTGNLGPGRYEVAITATQGDAVAEETGQFEILPDRAVAAAPANPRPPPDPELVPVLERAARYVVAYQDTFRDIVAEERYSQKVRASPRRSPPAAGARGSGRPTVASVVLADGLQVQTSRADLVFARLAGDVPWGVFRDVFEVNGNTVRDRDERLQRLFLEPSPSAMEQAWEILEESARYNVGPQRTVNIPTMALLYLHPRNQSRFEFERGGTRRIEGVEGLEVEFEEVQTPTLTRDSAGRSVPVKGRFWIDPSRGTVLRSEARYVAGQAEGFVTVEYRPEPRLAMWVPSEMWERYRNLPSIQEPAPGDSAEAQARYSNYRKFGVSVEETATVAQP